MIRRFNLDVFLFLWALGTLPLSLSCRSIHRSPDPYMPTIEVGWADEEEKEEKYVLKNAHLQQYPLFELFDKKFFYQHLLPNESISFRNAPEHSVAGEVLSSLIEKLLIEIKEKKNHYSDFTVLQDNGFNYTKACGLLITRFKDYPFVVKLFIEQPKSFIDPWTKGFFPIFFFYMGGGVNRHLSGFTRITNLAYIKQKIASSPYWSSLVDTPRKWFWIQKEPRWLIIKGTNIGTHLHQQSAIPATYAIIADAIESERSFSSFNKKDMETALTLSNFLEANLDLHITNFMLEKSTNKIVLIDTEHFPTMVGLKEKVTFDGYISWFMLLINKCTKDMLFCTRKSWREAQLSTERYLVPCVLDDLKNQACAQHTAQLC